MVNFLANHTRSIFTSVRFVLLGEQTSSRPSSSSYQRAAAIYASLPKTPGQDLKQKGCYFFFRTSYYSHRVIAVLRFFTTKSYRWRNLSWFQDSAQVGPEHSCKMQMDSSSGRASRCNKLAWWKFRDVVLECDVRTLEKSGSNSWKHSLWIEILQSTLPLRNKGSVRGSILLSWTWHFQTRPSTDGLRFKNSSDSGRGESCTSTSSSAWQVPTSAECGCFGWFRLRVELAALWEYWQWKIVAFESVSQSRAKRACGVPHKKKGGSATKAAWWHVLDEFLIPFYGTCACHARVGMIKISGTGGKTRTPLKIQSVR